MNNVPRQTADADIYSHCTRIMRFTSVCRQYNRWSVLDVCWQ